MQDDPLELEPAVVSTGSANRGRSAAASGVVKSKRLIAVASGDSIKVLDARLRLKQTLNFSDGYPLSINKGWTIGAIAFDSSNNRIVAAAGEYIVIWEAAEANWKVHSTVHASHTIDSVHLNCDTLVLCGSGISVYSKKTPNPASSWSKTAKHNNTREIWISALSPCGNYLATYAKASDIVQIWKLPEVLADSEEISKIQLISTLWHSDSVVHLSWRPETSNADNAALFTRTSNGAFRLYATFIDEPQFFALFATINHPYSAAPPLASFWIDHNLTKDGTEGATNSDYVVTIFKDGSVGVVSVSNLSQSPPTCVTQTPVHFHAALKIKPASIRSLNEMATFHFVTSNGPAFEKGRSALAIIGINAKSGSLLAIDLPLTILDSPSPCPAFVRQIRSRPTQPIQNLIVTADKQTVVTAGQSEITLWRVRYNKTQALALDSIGTAKLASRKVCVSVDKVFALVGQQIRVLTNTSRSRTLKETTILHCGEAVVDDIAFLDNFDGRSATLFAVSEGRIRAWTFTGEHQFIEEAPVSLSDVASTSKTHYQFHYTEPTTLLLSQTTENSCRVYTLLEGRVWHAEEAVSIPTGQLQSVAIDDDGRIALVTKNDSGHSTLSIHSMQQGEFNNGLEFSTAFEETSLNISWMPIKWESSLLMQTTTSGFVVYGKSRKRYLSEDSAWQVWSRVDIPHSPPAVWLADGSILAAAGNDLHLFHSRNKNSKESLMEKNTSQHAALPAWHPQFLWQCLIAGKSNMVDILLQRILEAPSNTDPPAFDVSLEEISNTGSFRRAPMAADLQITPEERNSTLDQFIDAREIVDSTEQRQFKQLFRLHYELQDLSRATDLDGFRYLLAMRTFTADSAVSRAEDNLTIGRLRYRDIVWAQHSETQEILVQQCSLAFNDKMVWKDARSVGLFMWLRSSESVSQQMEKIAKNSFVAKEDRDPITSSLFYLALKKRRLVLSLWKQSIGHQDRNNMVKFLNNNFEDARWRTAARKNAFVLLSKQRFEFAAAMFLLGDSVRDAVGICLKQLDDYQLALAIARVYEGDTGPTVRFIVEEHILPIAIGSGFRWLAHWCFWTLDRRDLAVRALVTPFPILATYLTRPPLKVGHPISDDPALAILYAQLRDWSVQTIRGARKISSKTEFNYVLYMAKAWRDLGCHWLALDLVRQWKFTSPIKSASSKMNGNSENHTEIHNSAKSNERPGTLRRRSTLLGHQNGFGRIKVDSADVASAVPSRAASPGPEEARQEATPDPDAAQIFKQAKKVAAAPEFDMSAFGF